MYQIKIQYFPNNEFRAVLSLQREKSGPSSSLPSSELGLEQKPTSHDGIPQCCGTTLPLTLDSNSEPGQDEVRAGFGKLGQLTKFGLNAKRTILRVGGAIEQTYPKDAVVFLTGTLPGSTNSAMRAIAEWSSWLVDCLKSWIAKRVRTVHSFYVWELQKRGALHLHYALVIEDEEIRKTIIKDFKLYWYKLIKELSRKAGVDCFERERGGSWEAYPALIQAYAQSVRKSVAGYLAKYCSKASGKVVDGQFYPVRWWGCSRPSLALMRSLTRERVMKNLSYTSARFRIAYIEQCTVDRALKRYTYWHQVGVGLTHIAYKFTDGIYQTWKDLMSKFPVKIKATSRSSSTTPVVTEIKYLYLNIFEHLKSLQFLRRSESIDYLGRLLEDLELRCSHEFQTVSTLLAFAATCKSHQLCRFMTWSQRSEMHKTQSILQTWLSEWERTQARIQTNLSSCSSTVDNREEECYLRTNSLSDEEGRDTKAATKDIIPQRAFPYDQLSLL